MRAVIDPNVLVSAWISPHGFPRRILDSADAGAFEMVVSQGLLAELANVLSRERLRRYGPIERAQAHVRRAMRVGVHVEIEGEPERVVPDDPKDEPWRASPAPTTSFRATRTCAKLRWAGGPSPSSLPANSTNYWKAVIDRYHP